METIRTFIAIEIPASVSEKLAQLQHQLKESQANVKWVATHNIHLTLKFLGNIAVNRIPQLASSVDEVARSINSFTMSLNRVGSFPSINRPQVIWVGVEKGEQELVLLQSKIEDQLASYGFDKERREFKPHITIGRLKSSKETSKLTELIKSATFSTPEFVITSIKIIKSQLTPEGPIYTMVHQSLLKQ